MRHIPTASLLVALAVACMGAPAGCTPSAPPTGRPARAESDFAAGQAPRLASRDMTLPAGCCVEDHTASLALYTRTTGVSFPAEAIGLVDLSTGRRSDVVTAPTSPGALNVLGSALSDAWIAWEEVWEAEEHWRLMAAPLDADRLTLGAPVIVDEADSVDRYRPLFALRGDTIAWATSGSSQAEPSTHLKVAGLLAGTRTETLTIDGIMTSMRLQDDTAVLTVRQDADEGDVVLAVGLGSGDVLARRALGNRGPTSHWVDRDGDTLAWAVFPDEETWIPDVFVKRAADDTMTAHTEACDPTIRGETLFFETAPTRVGGTPTGLGGVDLGTGTLFELVEPSPPDSPVWQLVTPVAEPGGLLLAWRDESAYPPADREPVCTLRIWEVR